jgi:hypothetical protein
VDFPTGITSAQVQCKLTARLPVNPLKYPYAFHFFVTETCRKDQKPFRPFRQALIDFGPGEYLPEMFRIGVNSPMFQNFMALFVPMLAVLGLFALFLHFRNRKFIQRVGDFAGSPWGRFSAPSHDP